MSKTGMVMKLQQNKNNTAYDLSRYERKVRSQTAPIRVVEQKAREKQRLSRIFTLRFMMLGLVVVAITGVFIYNQVVLTEVNDQIYAVNKEIKELESDNTILNMEVETKMSYRNIEEYATTKLGLSKLDADQIEYVDLKYNDHITKQQEEQSAWDKICEGIKKVFGQGEQQQTAN